MMEKTDETIPSREELAVFIEEAAVSVTNNYEEAPAVLMVDDAVIGTLGNFSIEWPHCSSLPLHVPREQEEDSVYRHGTGTPSLSTGTEAHPASGGNAG